MAYNASSMTLNTSQQTNANIHAYLPTV